MNARKPPVGVWQLSTSAAADGGVIGFSPVDEDKAFDCQIDGARIEIPSAMAANTVGTTNCKVIALWASRILALTYPTRKYHRLLSRGIGN